MAPEQSSFSYSKNIFKKRTTNESTQEQSKVPEPESVTSKTSNSNLQIEIDEEGEQYFEQTCLNLVRD